MQEAIGERARELWNDALNNIDGSVYSNKWKYLDYLEEIRYRKVVTITLQQVKETILSFWEFNEMKERENVESVVQVESTQDVAVEVATDARKDFELDVTENDPRRQKAPAAQSHHSVWFCSYLVSFYRHTLLYYRQRRSFHCAVLPIV